MATYFEHPSQAGRIEKLGGAPAYWLTFFFGPFYLIAKRAYLAAFLHATCAGVVGFFVFTGLSGFPYDRGKFTLAMIVILDFVLAAAFFDTPVSAYRKRGWLEVGRGGESSGLPSRT